MLSQTAVFTKLVQDYMGPPPVVVSESATCGEVVRRMRDLRANSVLVVDRDSRPVGIVTEQDVCRRITFQGPPDQLATDVMTAPLRWVRADDYLYHAIAEMRRCALRHMPVVDREHRAVGILQQHDALAVAAARMVEQIELLTHSRTLAGMHKTKAAQVEVATQLFADRAPAPEVQTLITSINNDLYRRIVDLCMRDMKHDGYGDGPLRFDVVVMGSGGRGESYLYPDQDNGFIIEDYPDADHQQVDAWFIELATRMSDALNEVGFPYCNGFVMATNPLWRKSISQWREQTTRWVSKGSGMVLRLADIFFDFTCVHGEGALTSQLREHVTVTARKPFFLREMYKLDAEHEVALGPFNRLLTDKLEGPNKGKLNLKLTGTLPLVGATRIAALAHGIPATSTRARIDALHQQGVLTNDEQDYLKGAFRHITNLLLRQQLRDYQAEQKVGNHVSLEDLSKRERDILIVSLKAIKEFRRRLRTELTGDLF